jgi:3-hydroxyacyl-CoA dehydrogenase, NAD binding domain
MSFTKIATAGAGTIGSQVAWQMAFHGKHVIVYDAIPEGLQKGKSLHREYAEHFIDQRGAVQKQIDDTFARLCSSNRPARAVASGLSRRGVCRDTLRVRRGERGSERSGQGSPAPRRTARPPRDAPAHSSGPGQKPSMPTKGT